MVAAAAFGQKGTTGSSNAPNSEAVADAMGNLHVPDAYRTTYQALGSWAVAADQGQGSRALGGIVGYRVRVTSPSCSSPFNVRVSMRCDIPSIRLKILP